MRIHRTYDGRSFDVNLPLSHFQSKEDLFDAVSLTTGVPSDDIICMTKIGQQINEEVLENMQDVSSRSVEDMDLFVFHRQFLYSDLEVLVAELEEVADLEAPLEEVEAATPPTPRSLTALVDWCAVLLSNMSIHNTQSMERLDQLSIIQRSTEIALSNLLSHSHSVRQTGQVFDETSTKELIRMKGLLNGHETDLKILSLVQINPKLLSVPDSAKSRPKERTLGDYVSPSKMGAVFQACSNVQSELEESARGLKYSGSQLIEDTEGLRIEVEGTNTGPSQETFEESRQALLRASELCDFIMATCSPDDQGWSAAARLANDDAMMKKVHEAMGELVLLDEVIRESLRRLTADKNEMIARSLHLLGDISSLQSDYADLGIELNQLDADFKSNRIDGFRHLARLKNMLWAYGSTLIEIYRRKEFENKFLFRSQALAEVMANLTASERRRRIDFRGQVVGALPWEIKGMDDNTPNLEISAGNGKGVDEIDIGKADIDEMFQTLDFVEGRLLESDATTPIHEVKTSLQLLIDQFDEAEGEFRKLVETGLLGRPEEDSDSEEEEENTTRLDRRNKNGLSHQVEKERLQKEVEDMKMKQGERERAVEEAHDQEISTLRADISKLKAERRHVEHDLESEKAQHEETRRLLESRIADAELEAARRINMEEEVVRLRRDVEDARRSELDFKVEANEEVERANDLEAHLHDLQIELKEAKDARNDASSRIEALLNKDSTAEKQISLAQERIDELSDQLSQARVEERKAKEAQYETETARDKTMRTYRAEADGDRAILEEKLRSQNVSLLEAKERLKRKEREVGEYLESVKNLQGQLVAADEAHEELVRQLESTREINLETEMAKRQSDRNLEAIVEKLKPLMNKLIDLHNAHRDMPILQVSSKNGSKNIKELPAEEAVDPELSAQKEAAIKVFQRVTSEVGAVESIVELITCLSRFALLEKVIVKIEGLPLVVKKYVKVYKHTLEKVTKSQNMLKEKITFRNFAIGDLALFLPTRNNSGKPWAAFNINSPHFFLNFTGTKENESLKESLQTKEWIVARIIKIECRVSTAGKQGTGEPDGNPFQLPEGVKFYLLDVEGWSTSLAPLTRQKSASATFSTGNSTSTNHLLSPPSKKRDTSSASHDENGVEEIIVANTSLEEGHDIEESMQLSEAAVSPQRRRASSIAAIQTLSKSSPVPVIAAPRVQPMIPSRASSPSGIAISLRNRSASPEVKRSHSRHPTNEHLQTGFTPWSLTSEGQNQRDVSVPDKSMSSSLSSPKNGDASGGDGVGGERANAAAAAAAAAAGEAMRRGIGMDNLAPAFGGRRKKLGIGLSSASGGYGTAMLQSRSVGGPLSPPLAQAKSSQQIMPISVPERPSSNDLLTGTGMDNTASNINPFQATPATASAMPDYFGKIERRSSRPQMHPSTEEQLQEEAERSNNSDVFPRTRRESSSSSFSNFRGGIPNLATPRIRAIPSLSPSTEVAQGFNSFGHKITDDGNSQQSGISSQNNGVNRSDPLFTRSLSKSASTRRLNPSASSSSSWTSNWTLGRKSGSKVASNATSDGSGAPEEDHSSSTRSASQSLRRLADGRAAQQER
ncbi:hypothetical protein CBS101457_001435 [Exobasidium rhododendri]|nr:hypothetical protein CBS101457_001435 [Exobasidium rhododendri]